MIYLSQGGLVGKNPSIQKCKRALHIELVAPNTLKHLELHYFVTMLVKDTLITIFQEKQAYLVNFIRDCFHFCKLVQSKIIFSEKSLSVPISSVCPSICPSVLSRPQKKLMKQKILLKKFVR